MTLRMIMLATALATLGAAQALRAQLVISGNDNKIDLTPGTPTVLKDPAPDSVTLLDFSTFPPKVQHVEGISNTVIGPPSNLDIAPDGSLALVAQSIKIDPADSTKFVPASEVHILDLSQDPPKKVGSVKTGQQPSGLSIASNGTLALVANRAEGSISVLKIDGMDVTETQRVEVCPGDQSLSDVAISPDGKLALASVQNGGYLAELSIRDGEVSVTGRKYSVYGKPYRVVITPDGELGISGGIGFGAGPDRDAVSVIDLKADPPRVIDHVAVGSVLESIEISPDGQILAATAMDSSNLAPDDPMLTEKANIYILMRKDRSFEVTQTLPIDAIPEGVAFTSDGNYMVVTGYPDRSLQIFSVRHGRVRNTGERVKTPAMPASIRAAR